MEKLPVWDPNTDWKHTDIRWEKVIVSKEDLKKFNERSNFKGFAQVFVFLLFIAFTGAFSYYFFSEGKWLLLAISLNFHGMFYSFFSAALHELIHNTVFKSLFLNKMTTMIFGILYWPFNPYLYRLSHLHFHHRYTLHQNSDGEDVPNYVDLSKKSVFLLLFRVVQFNNMMKCICRLFTLKPCSKNWRLRGYKLDKWEQFVLEKANEKERKEVHRFALISLVFHVIFAVISILTGHWFLIILTTLAPFYGMQIYGYIVGIHQHACCEANNPDYRISCNTVKLDPISSMLYWHMEHHTEHHMYASIPCYNLKKFSNYISDQMPEKEGAIRKILKFSKISPIKFGSLEKWREDFGRYKGF